jgi:phosphoribosylformimino-5-aminoimidazole carboxamide ribotide isomerase
MHFRPCIDLHGGQVKQIVGSTLSDCEPDTPQTNFSSSFSPSYYSRMYRQDNLTGGHVIMLGPGNENSAIDALAGWPGGMQVGGGITADNAELWLERGASHVIVTSFVFHDGRLDEKRLQKLISRVGTKRLVLDLSCRKKNDKYFVVTDRWQKFTDLNISNRILTELSSYCAEFLIHAVDVEGKCMGVDSYLVNLIGDCSPVIPITYAGGVSSLEDLEIIKKVGQGKLAVTVGSALDIFGGTGLVYREVINFCR